MTIFELLLAVLAKAHVESIIVRAAVRPKDFEVIAELQTSLAGRENIT